MFVHIKPAKPVCFEVANPGLRVLLHGFSSLLDETLNGGPVSSYQLIQINLLYFKIDQSFDFVLLLGHVFVLSEE